MCCNSGQNSVYKKTPLTKNLIDLASDNQQQHLERKDETNLGYENSFFQIQTGEKKFVT